MTMTEIDALTVLRQMSRDGSAEAGIVAGLVSDLKRQLGAATAMVERQRGQVEDAKRQAAIALQQVAEVSAVKKNIERAAQRALMDKVSAISLLERVEPMIPTKEMATREVVAIFLDSQDPMRRKTIPLPVSG